MKKLTAILVSLVLAVSLLVGVGVMAGAENTDGIVQSSLNLAENVTVYVEVAIAAPTDGAYAKITTPDGKVDNQLLSDAAKNGDNYVFTAEVAVKDLAGDVTVEILNADGTTLVEAEKTSAVAYCDQYLETTPDGEFAALVGALKAYAGAALTYFSDDILAEGATAPDLSAVADMKLQGELPAGITHKSVTLLLENETVIRHYFILEAGKLIENYKFFVDKNANGVCNADEKLAAKAKTNADGSVVYYVDIEGITPNELDEVYTLGVTGTDGKTYTCAYGALTYLKRVATAEASDDMKALATALVNYNAEAGKLVGTVTFDANGGSTVADQTYEYGVNTPIVAPTTLANNYFMGWADVNGNIIDTIPASATGTVALKAVWETIDYTHWSQKLYGVVESNNGYCSNHADAEPLDGKCDKCGYCTPSCVDANKAQEIAFTPGTACTLCGKTITNTTLIGNNVTVYDLNHAYYVEPATVSGIQGSRVGFANIAGISWGNCPWGVFSNSKWNTIAGMAGANVTHIRYGFTMAKLSENATVPNLYMRVRSGSKADFPIFELMTDGTIKIGAVSTGVKIDTTARSYEIVLDITDGANKNFTFYLLVDGVVAYKTLVKSAFTSAEISNGDGLGQLRFQSPGEMFLGNRFVCEWHTVSNPIIYPGDAIVPAGSPSAFTPGTVVDLPATATREGCVFGGWYADEALTQPIDAVPANAAGNFRVYAKWYKVTKTAIAEYADIPEYVSGYCSNHKDGEDADTVCDVCGYCVEPKCTPDDAHLCAVCGKTLLNDKQIGLISSKEDLNYFYTKKVTKNDIAGTVYGVSNCYGNNVPFGTITSGTYASNYNAGATHIYYSFVMARAYEDGSVTPFTARVRDGGKADLNIFNIMSDGEIRLFSASTGVKLDTTAREYTIVYDISDGANKIIDAKLYVDGALVYSKEVTIAKAITEYTWGDQLGQFRLGGAGAIWFGSFEAGVVTAG